jgi:ankyrin repeat protein
LAVNKFNYTPIHIAIRGGRVEYVKNLLEFVKKLSEFLIREKVGRLYPLDVENFSEKFTPFTLAVLKE